MNIELERKHYVIFASVVTVLVVGIVLFYYLSYAPQQAKIDQKRQEINIEEQLIQVLDQQLASESANLVNTMELQRKIPVTAYIEQLILELEKAEVLSNSQIINMTFGDADFTPSTTLDEYIESNTTLTDEEMEEQEQEQQDAYLPEGLKRVTVNLSVQSNDYEDLTLFLESLESLTRVIQIESVAFTGQPELTSVTQNFDPLNYSVQLSAFYHPELTDLIEDLPPISVPEPSNKTNPFIDNE
ncbi:pilus assembly protein PilO [Sutcliffiella deserti]|uniref:pilus assembly protein PilO n=1 Tax=Sutcliffiella deserti TaxID=2875501 RepID=UPI001CBF5863|nr:pilus assembly protein PilO [Sutcliffiella deserti]